ncbi:ph-response sensor protein [Pseudogymnoascus australis]
MYSDVSPTTSSSRLASSGRSILSRLTSPLRSRTRNATDFHIRASEPHRQYSPGDIVKGIVVLTVVKPIRITHLTVALHGFVRVLKKPAAAGEVITSDHVVEVASNKRSQYTGNGHVSLFHDEITLCGEGRLEPGIYEFEFNLQFPTQGLPSSIDFERGTISYMIRSTLTRPTSIAATSTCERKISLVETVDIGPLSVPKPRTISLEPIAKNSRKHIRSAVRADQAATESGNSAAQPKPTDSAAAEESASQRPSTSNPPSSPTSPLQSDLQSEISEGSVVSSSSTGYVIGHSTQSKPVSSTPDAAGNKPAPNKTITAKIELLKAGCLPGDSIPITISIQHTKRIKSLHGIIITLYRQGRIDSAPPLSLFTDIKGKDLERLKHEEYYPKSKTGLGGLSLTSAGSSSVFRKDLSQTLAPIMIDPATLSTVVTASLRVPEDVFPTITGVPGEMISFRYYVEVVVDLGGKLAGQDRHLPRLGMVSLPSMTNPNDPVLGTDSSTAPTLAAWGGNIVNTDRIRREKSVVACLFEIILGTTDSARMRGRGNTTKNQGPAENIQTSLPTSVPPLDSEGQQNGHVATAPGEAEYQYDEYGQQWSQWPQGPRDQTYTYNGEQHTAEDENQVPEYTQSTVPPPQVLASEELTEKDRVRLAEQTLLPSQPLQDLEGAGPSAPPQPTPTAPPDPDDDLYNDDYRPVAQQRLPATVVNGIAHSSDTITPASPQTEEPQAQATAPSVDDKRELERRRLQAEASSPSDFPAELDDTAGEGPSGSAPQPSAPFLDEEDEFAGQFTSRHDGLPRYER